MLNADSLGLTIAINWQDLNVQTAHRVGETLNGLGVQADRFGVRMTSGFGRADRAAGLFGNQLGSLNRLITSLGLTAGTYGIARILGLTSVPREAADAEHALTALGNVGDLSARQVQQYGTDLIRIGRETNQLRKDLTGGLNTLVAAGLDADKSLAFMPIIGKTATASQAAVNDLAVATFTLHDNLKVATNDLERSLNILTASGKEGRFELKDMAREFPALTANIGRLKTQGIPAVAQLGAALQIAMKGAGNPAEAANNLANFIKGITSPLVLKNFKDVGVNIVSVIDEAAREGADPLDRLLSIIAEKTKGKVEMLGELFRDAQAQNFILPMIANLEEYRRIRDTVINAEGIIDEDFNRMMGTFNEQLKRLKINLSAIVLPTVEKFMRSLNWLLERVNNSTFLLYSTLGLLASGGILSVVSVMGFLIAGLAKYKLMTAGATAMTTGLQAALQGVSTAATVAAGRLTLVNRFGAAIPTAATAGQAGLGAWFRKLTGGGITGVLGKVGKVARLGGRALPYVGTAAMVAPLAIDAWKWTFGSRENLPTGGDRSSRSPVKEPLDLSSVFDGDRPQRRGQGSGVTHYDYSIRTVHNKNDIRGGDPTKIRREIERMNAEDLSRSPGGMS